MDSRTASLRGSTSPAPPSGHSQKRHLRRYRSRKSLQRLCRCTRTRRSWRNFQASASAPAGSSSGSASPRPKEARQQCKMPTGQLCTRLGPLSAR
eukprot:4856962-Prymnesium_polylepis.1